MLTIKERRPDGTEVLYTADTITVIGGPDCHPTVPATPGRQDAADPATLIARDMFREGIFLDRDTVPLDPSCPTGPVYGAKHVIQFGGDETAAREARRGGTVWVMNEHGSTVATYRL